MAPDSLQLRRSAVPASVGELRHAVTAYADAHSIASAQIGLAVSELLTNAILHGYRDGQRGDLHLQAELRDRCLWVTVTDRGVGMRPRTDSPGLGLGLPLVSQLASHVDIETAPEGGTRVCACFAAEPESSRPSAAA